VEWDPPFNKKLITPVGQLAVGHLRVT
jgi:hypothetical protein